MQRFNDIANDITYVLLNGRMPHHEKIEKKGPIREVILHGSKARGAGYRIRKRLQDQFNIVCVTSSDQRLDTPQKPTILFLDLRNFDSVPEHLKQYAKEHENASLLVVDVDHKEKHELNFSYSVEANYYLRSFERDIDPAISRMIAELYLNVDFAVDDDGLELEGKLVKPFFRTSFLVGYERSRDILEGILRSVIRKFNPDVLASREKGVNMYALAKPLAESLGIQSVVIERNSEGEYSIQGDVRGKRVLLLEDVVGKGSTKIELIKHIQSEGGQIKSCIVLLDRNEGAAKTLAQKGVELYSLTDLVTYQKVTENNRRRKTDIIVKDVDPGISRMIAELYLNVDFAVDDDGLELEGKLVKPYFKTSFLIDYERSYDILEGILRSVIRKFNPDVLASREILGIPPEDDVKMYELAKPLAESLGIQSAMIRRNSEGRYTIIGNVRGKRALLLEDVIGNASTKIELVKAIQESGGEINACVVLLDRNEGGNQVLAQKGVELYSLTDLNTYREAVEEKKRSKTAVIPKLV